MKKFLIKVGEMEPWKILDPIECLRRDAAE